MAFDAASLDVGSTVAGLEVPGVREHAIPTRPIARFVERMQRESTRSGSARRWVVVGAGGGGVELAFALHARFPGASVTLLEGGPRILRGGSAAIARRVEGCARRAGVTLRTGARVTAIEADHVRLEDGDRVPCEVAIWVAGAAPHDWLRETGLPLDDRGFVRIGPTLQVSGCDGLFAVGDCASLEGAALPKAGVYAVRQGPVLARNLDRRMRDLPLRRYRPQSDFLTLLNLGDGRAIGGKWGLGFEGRWVFALKDRIDRRFMRRFQVLTADGVRTAEFPPMPGEDAMVCGGCAAKVGESSLVRALSRLDPPEPDPDVVLGLPEADDAAAVRTRHGALWVSSVDAFRAFTDDPWLVGRVSAVHSASDLWAKGVEPRFAQAWVQMPEQPPVTLEEELFQVLAGARASLDPCGITLLGGHTTTGESLAVGFALWGEIGAGKRLLRLSGLRPGDRLVLTRPLGTGVLFAADMRGRAAGPWVADALQGMLRPNASACRVALACAARAATDVSGFGLAGHLGAMLRASRLSARIAIDALPLLPGVETLLASGLRSSFHEQNAQASRGLRIAPDVADRPTLQLLFDPQTSGGLLFGVAPDRACEAIAALRSGGDSGAAVIGTACALRADGAIFEVVASEPAEGPLP
ncbi:MAG: selenide, water dikinase SelD [Myxococcota bacterium]